MANKPANIVIVGSVCMLAGGFYALQGLGVIASPQFKPGTDKAMLALCVGAAFLCAGPAAMLTLVRAPPARTAINVLTLVIVVCMASIGAWVALNAEPGRISGPLAFISPKLNDLSGRIAFGLGSLVCVGIAISILRGLLRPAKGNPSDDARA